MRNSRSSEKTSAGQKEKPAAPAKKRKLRGAAVLFSVLFALFVTVFGLMHLMRDATPVDVAVPPVPSGTNALPPVSSIPTEQGLSPAAWDFVGPVEDTINPMRFVQPDHRMIALPENGRVDISYLHTVTFAGDSISQGLFMYEKVPPEAHNSTYKNISPKAFYDGTMASTHPRVVPAEIPIDAIVASQPDNVYILLGANAMASRASSDEAVLHYYRELLVHLKERLLPGVGIYVQSITPVRPNNDNGFTMERINGLNDQLAQIAYEEGVYFVNINEALMDAEGYLKEEYSWPGGDGLHLHPNGYDAWVDYLLTHTAYHPRNSYLSGSPYHSG